MSSIDSLPASRSRRWPSPLQRLDNHLVDQQRELRERVALHDNLAAGLDDLGLNFDVELARMDPLPAEVQSRRRLLAQRIREFNRIVDVQE